MSQNTSFCMRACIGVEVMEVELFQRSCLPPAFRSPPAAKGFVRVQGWLWHRYAVCGFNPSGEYPVICYFKSESVGFQIAMLNERNHDSMVGVLPVKRYKRSISLAGKGETKVIPLQKSFQFAR